MSVGIQHVFVRTLDVVAGTQLKHNYVFVDTQHLSLDTHFIVIFDELDTVVWVKHEIANSDTLDNIQFITHSQLRVTIGEKACLQDLLPPGSLL